MHVYVGRRGAQVAQHICGGQRTTLGSRLSPSTLEWLPGLSSDHQACLASTYTPEPSITHPIFSFQNYCITPWKISWTVSKFFKCQVGRVLLLLFCL